MATKMQEDKSIIIATYNIFLFSNPKIIAQNIFTMKEQGVDIFCLQEVLKIKGKQSVGEEIIQLLGKDWNIEYNLGNDDANLTHGVAIIWNSQKLHKLEIKKIILPELPKFSFTGKFFRYVFGFQGIKFSNKALSITFSQCNKLLRVTLVHIALAGGSRHHMKQHQFLSNSLSIKPLPNEVICGDFNSLRGISYKRELQSIKNTYGKEFLESCSEISWTQDLYLSTFAREKLSAFIRSLKIHYHQNLDHILVKGASVFTCKRMDIQGSDHFPLTTTVILN